MNLKAPCVLISLIATSLATASCISESQFGGVSQVNTGQGIQSVGTSNGKEQSPKASPSSTVTHSQAPLPSSTKPRPRARPLANGLVEASLGECSRRANAVVCTIGFSSGQFDVDLSVGVGGRDVAAFGGGLENCRAAQVEDDLEHTYLASTSGFKNQSPSQTCARKMLTHGFSSHFSLRIENVAAGARYFRYVRLPIRVQRGNQPIVNDVLELPSPVAIAN